MAKSRARRDSLEAHLRALKLEDQYSRFEAVVGSEVYEQYEAAVNPGALGCALSHEGVLKAYSDCGDHLHVIEDDTVIHPLLPITFDAIEGKFKWDIIYTDTFMVPSPIGFNMLNRFVEQFDASRNVTLQKLGPPHFYDFASESSYFVHRDSISRLRELLDGSWTKCDRDSFTTKLIREGKVKAFITVPFLSTLSAHDLDSNINDPDQDQGTVDHLSFMRLLRESLYIDADIKALHRETIAKAQEFSYSRRLDIFGEFMKYHLSYVDSKTKRWTTSARGGTDLRITNVGNSFYARNPAVTITRNGDILICWQGNMCAKDRNDIFLSFFDNEKQQWQASAFGRPDVRITDGSSDSTDPDIDVDFFGNQC